KTGFFFRLFRLDRNTSCYLVFCKYFLKIIRKEVPFKQRHFLSDPVMLLRRILPEMLMRVNDHNLYDKCLSFAVFINNFVENRSRFLYLSMGKSKTNLYHN